MKEVNRDINERIKQIAHDLFKDNITAMAKATFISRSTIYSIIGEQNSQPGYDVIRKLVEMSTYDINLDWLITGCGEMLKAENSSAVINYEHRGAPYYNVDFIGGFDVIPNDQTIQPDYYIDFPPYNKDGVVWCNVTGHSMEPEIYHGDIIALKDTNETNPNYLPFGEVYALVTENYRTIKRLSKSDKEGFIRLVPTNPAPEYASQDIPVSHIRKIYQVLVSVKRF